MAARLTAVVWDHYPEGGGEFLVALALADHGDPDGTNIFPSVATLAKMARQSERATQYHIRKMQERGWLIKVKDAHRGKPTEYRIPVELIPKEIRGGVQILHRLMGAIGVQNEAVTGAIGVQKSTDTGATAAAPNLFTKTKDHRPAEGDESPPAEPHHLNGKIVATIPLVDKTEFGITETFLHELELAYPSVDGPQTLKEIRVWCLANPKQCKTRNGAARFINNWFSREQNRGHQRH